MFDSLLASQPKRLDLWHVWLQCEIKQGDLDTIRALFEKVCAMLWSSKKVAPHARGQGSRGVCWCR